MAELRNSEPSNVEFLIGEPLDTQLVKVNGRNGVQQTVPALHIGFMEVRGYVYFKSVPVITSDTGQEDGLSADEEEWLESMSFLEDDLHWLLRLPHHRFWSQVVYEEDMHKCLESYLTLAPRDYDLINMNIREEVRVQLQKIHRLVFLIFLRMSTYKESKEHHIRPHAYGDIIYDNFVFDVPKLMDLCVLYGFQNKAILSRMMKNIFSVQPKYSEDLIETSSFALNAFNFAEEKLFLNVPENLGDCRKLESDISSGIKEMTLSTFSDVISYITDACATVYLFLDIYSPACDVFRQNGAMSRLPSFYEKTFPAVEKEIRRRLKIKEDPNLLECVKKKVMLSKTFLINTFRNILSYCCIQHILDPDCAEIKTSFVPPSEEFINIFTEVACEKIFLQDYNSLYPLENDMELINATGAYLDTERLSYVFGSIHDNFDTNAQVFTSTAENGARPKVPSKSMLPEDGAIKSLQNVAAILKPKTQNSQQNGVPSAESDDSHPSEYQMDLLIHSVKDILPDLGAGFIEEGLKYFGYDPEKLIDAVLSDSLPSCLDTLDRSLQRNLTPENNAASQPTSYSVLAERKNIYDNDEFDVFSRSDVNMENIHLGKKDKTPSTYHNLKDEKDSEFLKHLICIYGDQESEEEEELVKDKVNVYEDEYDDTYDSTLVGKVFLEEEVENNEPDKAEQAPENTEEIREPQPDDFCINPEILRKKDEERRQAKFASRNRGNSHANPGTTNSKQNKERNKAYSANHNRRKQSDFKKSRGMIR